MAEIVLKPDPQRYPVGTKVRVYPRPPAGGKLEGQPAGTLLEEPTVASDGTLTVKGVLEGKEYVGWVSGNTYLTFAIPFAPSEGGISQAAVEALIAEKAVSTASPAFTGTPTAPTAAPATNNTQLATTAYADAIAALKANLASPALTGVPKAPTAAKAANTTQVATTAYADDAADVEKKRAEAAEALLAALASPALTGVPKAPTAAKGTNTTQLATTAFAATTQADAEAAAVTKDTAAREAAELASAKREAVHAVITTEVTAEPDELSPVDATAGALKIKLKAGLGAGRVVTIEKNDASANTVTVEGNMRGEAGKTFVLTTAKQAITFMTDGAGSWWPINDHFTTAATKAMTRQIIRRSISIGAGVAPGNEILLDEYVPIVAGETRKILWVEAHTSSGTIKVAVARGEAGTTAIAAYEAIAVTNAIQQISSTTSLVDKDRLRITTSAGATPKGLTITWAEELVAP